jgi:hypothetical protein
VFALPFTWTQGLVAPPDDLVSADGSATYWAAGKAIRQALRADLNTLEMLFLPGAKPLDPIGEWILAERDAFVSVEIYGTFGRYALGQLRRLEQGVRLAEHRTVVLDWLRADPSLTLDAVAAKLAKVSTRATSSEADGVHQAKQYVKQLYRSLADQGLLETNEFAALVEFAKDKAAAFDLPRELRPKNAYNLVRLLTAATRWLSEGVPTFEAEGTLRDRLLAIKKGAVAIDTVLAEAEAMAPALERAKDQSPLPKRPDVARADALLRRIGDSCGYVAVRRRRTVVEGLLGSLVPHVVHPELCLETRLPRDLRVDPPRQLGAVLLGQVVKLDQDQGQRGEALLAIHDVHAPVHDVRYVRVQVVPWVVRGDGLLAWIEIALPLILLGELVK